MSNDKTTSPAKCIIMAFSNKKEYANGGYFESIEAEIPHKLSKRETVEYIYSNYKFPILADGDTPVPGAGNWEHEPEIGLIEWESGKRMKWFAGRI